MRRTGAAAAVAAVLVDPHGPDWAQFPEGEAEIGAWLAPQGSLLATCGDHPCYMAGWNGP